MRKSSQHQIIIIIIIIIWKFIHIRKRVYHRGIRLQKLPVLQFIVQFRAIIKYFF